MRTIYCQRLQQNAEGLDAPPMPGELGEKIYQQISKKSWNAWLQHQTMLINEYRLSLIDPKARVFLKTEMDKFLFGEGSETPAGYIEDKNNHKIS